jgi:2-methylisocitrate lyase-like PEP mutase family enzyme
MRALLARPGCLVVPACFDALSAKLIERAGFEATFMSGFSVAGARLGMPDTGLISYGEMLDQGRNICAAISLPVIGDGDTGYGNPMNVRRTVQGYAAAGFACVMIEDQVAPKRCGHTEGKQVVSRDEALARIRAAVDARDDGADILIMARTDANAPHGFDEAMGRIRDFAAIGADILFLEAPTSVEQMKKFCEGVPGPKMANMLEGGATPVLPPAELGAIGFKIALYPIDLLSASIAAMNEALAALKAGKRPPRLTKFSEMRDIVGFDQYRKDEDRYAS